MTDHDGRSLDDYDRLEREVGEWADENFGEAQPAYYALVGAVEELGELAELYEVHEVGRMAAMLELIDAVGSLAHSVLKQTQGIREDDDDVGRFAELQAVDDIIEHAHALRAHPGDSFGPGVASIPRDRADEAEVADAVGDTHVYLADMSHRLEYGYTLGEAVELAWYDEVTDRDWDADVDLGGGSP